MIEISRLFTERIKSITKKFKNASKKFQESFKGASKKIPGCFKEDWWVCQGSFKWGFSVSLKIECIATSKWILVGSKYWRVLQWSFKWISMVFERNSNCVSRDFKGFKGIWTKKKGCYKRPLRVIQDNFNGIQENFEWWFKGASNWFKEVSKRFKESVKCVSRKF